jgi:hypothetical protein
MPVGRDTVTITKSAVARVAVDDSLTTTGLIITDHHRSRECQQGRIMRLAKRFSALSDSTRQIR